jgi:uncharacterized Zn finger protein
VSAIEGIFAAGGGWQGCDVTLECPSCGRDVPELVTARPNDPILVCTGCARTRREIEEAL